ncbi:MAG: MarR family transcriptional regulator [Solobacterium sp.]|nr:MarR family transcriptional regulator [Solobacterium sp.]
MNALDILGLTINFKKWNKEKQLPLFILNDYLIQKAIINDIECLSLTPKGDIPTLPAFKKQLSIIREIENVPIFLQLNAISSFRKRNLLENKIPFILKDKMAYLPFMTTYLTNTQYEDKSIEKISLATQLLFTWILYQNTNKYYVSDAVKSLGFSNMTLTRAYRQLCATELFKEHKDGRKIFLTTKLSKVELFNKMKAYLQPTFYSQGFILKKEITKDMIPAGEFAFSQHTHLNPPKLKTYAIEKKHIKNIKLQRECYSYDEQVELQIWKYNPLLFSQNSNSIDTVSLIISLLENIDERLGKEIKNFFERD